MNDFATAAPPHRGGLKFKHLVLLLLLAFIGGIIGAGWLAKNLGVWDGKLERAAAPVASVSVAPRVVPFSNAVPPDDAVSEIENRLSRINADAAAASGNATRAEALLIAFAARRALESGAPLGYLADQLRLRFGSSQPQAVATILTASQSPVTIEALRTELTALDNALVSGVQDAGVWTTVRREFADLFVLRKDGTPSTAPSQRLLRAHAMVESGNIGGAVSEVSAMPGASAATAWLIKARRYDRVHTALDILERNAIVTPAPAPVVLVPAAPSVETPIPVP